MFPDTAAWLSVLFSCGKKITGMIPILSSKNNSRELAWTKDHPQKDSMDAATLFWKLRQFNTTKIQQLASMAWDGPQDHFLHWDRHSHCFPSSLFLRNMKKLKTPSTKIHYIKGPLHTGWCDGGSVKAGQCIYIALTTRSSLTVDTCYLSPGQYLDTASVGLSYTCLLPSPSTLRRSIWAWTQPAGQWGIRETFSLIQHGNVFRISMIAFSNKRQCWSEGAVALLGHYSWEIAVCVQTHLYDKMLNIYMCVCMIKINTFGSKGTSVLQRQFLITEN